MSKKRGDTSNITEYHVVFTDKPDELWEVHYGDQRMGYKAWDKRVAISAAKSLDKGNRPGKVVIHDRKGPLYVLFWGRAQKLLFINSSRNECSYEPVPVGPTMTCPSSRLLLM
jgi:hypothetical protein